MQFFKVIKNLFPDDTRIVELASAISLSISCFLLFIGVLDHPVNLGFYTVFAGLVSLLQLYSLVFVEKLEKLRVYCSLAMGGLLIYLGFLHADQINIINCSHQIVLGIANVYAFLVNNQRLK